MPQGERSFTTFEGILGFLVDWEGGEVHKILLCYYVHRRSYHYSTDNFKVQRPIPCLIAKAPKTDWPRP